MQKRREIFIVVGFIFVTAFFSVVIYYSGQHSITGFAILDSQPNITQPITINTPNMRNYLITEFEKFTEEINNLKQKLTKEEKPSLVEELKTCEQELSKLENNIEKEEFINANNNVKETEECIQDIEDKSSKLKKLPFTQIQMAGYIVWIIVASILLILIAILIIVLRFFYRKLNLLTFIKGQQATTTPPSPTRGKEFIEDKLKRIKENLG